MTYSKRNNCLIDCCISLVQGMFKNANKSFFLSCLVIISIQLLSSCGGSKEIFQPNINEIKSLEKVQDAPNIKVVEVNDLRAVRTNEVGYARVGMLENKVPLIIGTPLKDFIRDAFNKTLNKDTLASLFLPVKISIDSFWAYEPNNTFGPTCVFYYAFTFSYPQTNATIQSVTINGSTRFSNVFDATYKIPEIIYEGINESSTKFLAYLNNNKPSNALTEKFNEKIFSESKPTASVPPSTLAPIVFKDTVKEVIKKKVRRNFDFSFYKGNKINSGGQIAYAELYNNVGSKYEVGWAIGLTYVNIEYTKDNSLKESGELLSSSFPIIGRYYFNKDLKGMYLSSCLKLSFGNESNNGRKIFFMGPTIDAGIGVQIGSAVSLQAGYFFLAHFGSKMLPNDHGFSINLSVNSLME